MVNIVLFKDRLEHKNHIGSYKDVRSVGINTDKMKYTGIVCYVTRMQSKILMRRELTSLSDICKVRSLWKIANGIKIINRETSVSVCLSGYKFGVCIWLSKDVNAETKKSIIWLTVLYGCER
jgi:hypothetical protein